ncbi:MULTISPECIES: hypothetical protein [unclassified Frankia]|uniref:hypothetical protein n=1 Tax=unclassified Frankia TaxID=2632575 RepID=UPI004043BFD5
MYQTAVSVWQARPNGTVRSTTAFTRSRALPDAEDLLGARDRDFHRLPDAATVHLDSGYHGQPSRDVLAAHRLAGEIVPKGERSPVQFGRRWAGERTHFWMNGYGKLRRRTEKNGRAVDFYLYLAAAFVTVRRLIQEARRGTAGPAAPPPVGSRGPAAGCSCSF